MASNKDVRTEIETLCTERGVAVPEGLDKLGGNKLAELLESMRREPSAVSEVLPGPVLETALRPLVAPSPVEGSEPPGDAASNEAPGGDKVSAPPPAPAAAVPAPKAAPTGSPGYFVAEGKTVNPSTGRDALGAFEQVYARDFIEGQAALDQFVAAGYLFKR